MRVIGSQPLAFQHRPFQGSGGASLYVGTSAAAINYRRNRILDSAQGLIANLDGETDLGASSFAKSQAVAQVTAPTNEIEYTLPPALIGNEVWFQVRTFAGDRENDSIYRPRKLITDVGGDSVESILGTITGIVAKARDGGGMRLRFNYQANRQGLQPDSFSVVKTAGSGMVPTVTVTRYRTQREIVVNVPSLSDGVTYTFSIVGHAGLVNTTLATGIIFTAVATNAGTVGSLTAEEY